MQFVRKAIALGTILTLTTALLPKRNPNLPPFKLFHFLPNVFEQASTIDKNMPDLSTYVQSKAVYKEFKTLALFDAIKCSDRVAAAQAKFQSLQDSDTAETTQSRMLEAVNDNQNELTFYLQADIRDAVQSKLNHEDSPWSLHLQAGSQIIEPSSIVSTSHTNMTKKLFGKKFSKNKDFYRVCFNLKGLKLADARLRNDEVQLIFRSFGLQSCMCWPAEPGFSPVPICQMG